MSRRPASFRLAIAGIVAMAAWLVVDPPAGASAAFPARLAVGVLCAAPLMVLLASARRADRRWGTWTALLMIPYVTFAVGALLMRPGSPLTGAVFATVAVLTFFAGLDASRRPRA